VKIGGIAIPTRNMTGMSEISHGGPPRLRTIVGRTVRASTKAIPPVKKPPSTACAA
jgi:hypothetical protein